ncbi:response regulator [Butyrivibrio sp. NC3005]|uniref:response regulator n=1 Tax=Butyrivibrio sp. NC3005 TaxID=1280685 RepID=UPI0004033642|nr:response regulator [Butyrivibrio sp. NC3005]
MRVFLVDDEIVVREGIREAFPWDESQYTLVGEAPDGEMAVPMIRDTNPDIVITDIKMPFMDGIELCNILRSQFPWISIIVLSGYDEFEYARKCIQLGVKEYLLKPINAEELHICLDKVRLVIEQEKKEREHAQSLRKRIETGNRFVKEKLIDALFSEDAMEGDAVNVLEQLNAMGSCVNASFYVVIDAAFSPVTNGQAIAAELADKSFGKVHTSSARSGTRLLVLGDSTSDTEERVYAVANSLSQELERAGCGSIRIGIGEIVNNPSDILKSFKSARHIRHLLVEKDDEKALILGCREFGDLTEDKKSLNVINEAKLYMTKHFTDSNLMLQDVARAVGMSNSRFSTVFSQQNGQTFTEYLIFLRLNKAKEMLRTTSCKSSQIAFDVGYNDAHYFSYIFKKNMRMTPSEYRMRYQNQPM